MAFEQNRPGHLNFIIGKKRDQAMGNIFQAGEFFGKILADGRFNLTQELGHDTDDERLFLFAQTFLVMQKQVTDITE